MHLLDIGGIPVPDAKGLETRVTGARDRARTDDALLADSMRTFDLLYFRLSNGLMSNAAAETTIQHVRPFG